MNIIKKLSAILLAVSMILGSSFVKNADDTYAASTYKKELKLGQTCYYDIDGDGDKDSIKYYVSNENISLAEEKPENLIDMVNDAFGDDKQEKKRLEKYGIGDLI